MFLQNTLFYFFFNEFSGPICLVMVLNSVVFLLVMRVLCQQNHSTRTHALSKQSCMKKPIVTKAQVTDIGRLDKCFVAIPNHIFLICGSNKGELNVAVVEIEQKVACVTLQMYFIPVLIFLCIFTSISYLKI